MASSLYSTSGSRDASTPTTSLKNDSTGVEQLPQSIREQDPPARNPLPRDVNLHSGDSSEYGVVSADRRSSAAQGQRFLVFRLFFR